MKKTAIFVFALAASLPVTATAQSPSYFGYFDNGSSVPWTPSPLQLRATGQPVIGTSFSLDLTNPPAPAMHALLIGPDPALIPYLNNTYLLVDPATGTTVSVPPGPTGEVSVPLDLKDPALLGTKLCAQYLSIHEDTLLASNLAYGEVGSTAGAPGFAPMVFEGTTVEMDNFCPDTELGTAVLNGTIDVDPSGAVSGDATVSLPDGSVATVRFTDGDDVHVLVGPDGEDVLDIYVHGGSNVIFNESVMSLDEVFVEVTKDIKAGKWTPLTQGIIALSALVSTEEFGANAQTAWLSVGSYPDLCSATLTAFSVWLKKQLDKGCDWLLADCRARGGKYVTWLCIDCDLLDAICRTGVIVVVAEVYLFLKKFWNVQK